MKLFLANILVLILVLLLPDIALAGSTLPGGGGAGVGDDATAGTACFMDINGNSSCPPPPDTSVEGFCSDVVKPNSIAGNIVRCVDKVVKRAGDKLLLRYTLLFANIIFYAVVIAIMIHGVKMMYGVANMQGITFTLIVKIMIVLYFSTPQGVWQIRQWRDAIIDFPKTIGVQILASVAANPEHDIIPGILNTDALVADFAVEVGGLTGTNILNQYLLYPAVYDRIDKMILQFFGMSCGDTTAAGTDPDDITNCPPGDPNIHNSDRQKQNNQLFIGIAALVVGLFATGPLGAQVAMVAIIYSTAIVFAVAELVLFFILIAVAINFLAAIAPLAIACILFERTHGMFKVWFSYVLSYLLQPIFLIAFLAIMLSVVGPITKDMAGFYKKVRLKWENASGNSNMETSMYKCLGSKVSSAEKANRMGNGSLGMNNILSTSFPGVNQASGNISDESDDCAIFAKTIRLDRLKTGAEEAPGQLTLGDVNSTTAKNLAITILMVMMIAFMKHIPQMMDRIVGQGLSGTSLMGTASAPADFTLRTVEKAGSKIGDFVKRGV